MGNIGISKTIGILVALSCATSARADEPSLVPVLGSGDAPPPNERVLAGDTLRRLASDSALVIGQESAPIDATPQQVNNASIMTCPASAASAAGLTDGWDMFSYSLDRNAAANLNLYASASMSAGDKIVLYQWMWYKDVLGTNGKLIGRCGSGISLALKARNLQANASLSLPFLAASAQLDTAEVEYRLGTFGISGPTINLAFPIASRVGEFNAQSYAELLSSIDKVQAAGNSATGVTFTPRIVALTADIPNAGMSRQVMVQAFALKEISNGRKCGGAKSRVPARDASTDGLVEDVYRYVVGAGACKDDIEPNSTIKSKAAADLRTFGLD